MCDENTFTSRYVFSRCFCISIDLRNVECQWISCLAAGLKTDVCYSWHVCATFQKARMFHTLYHNTNHHNQQAKCDSLSLVLVWLLNEHHISVAPGRWSLLKLREERQAKSNMSYKSIMGALLLKCHNLLPLIRGTSASMQLMLDFNKDINTIVFYE